MNTRQPLYGPGFRNAHLAEQTRLLTRLIELMEAQNKWLQRISEWIERDKS